MYMYFLFWYRYYTQIRFTTILSVSYTIMFYQIKKLKTKSGNGKKDLLNWTVLFT